MALTVIPAPVVSSSPIQSVQRGSAGGSGNVTITAVDISKSMVNIFGSASTGVVSASFNMSMNAGSMNQVGMRENAANTYNQGMVPAVTTSFLTSSYRGGSFTNTPQVWTLDRAVNSGNASVGAGSNNLVAAQVTGFLANSTTLTVSGACRFEIVEFK